MSPERSGSSPTRAWMWPLVAMLAATVPFASGLSLSRIFYVRDLTMYFWPQHLWIRRALLSGTWPSWDPYAAAGQAMDPNGLNQMFLPPVLLMRVLFPAVVGFNLIVATPFPLAALGTWLFLRRRFTAPAATIGAIAFAASGPMVSTGNFPNLSWSMAWFPWLLWAVDRDRDRPDLRRLALVAVMAALQMVSGEPVTLAASLVIAAAYAGLFADAGVVRGLARLSAAVTGAVVAASVQLVPMALAARHSVRGLLQGDNFWSLHPLWLAESVLPRIFGHTFDGYQAQMPWLWPLNSGRDPFFYSMYLGALLILLGVAGAAVGDRRWRLFWVSVVTAGVLCSLGSYAPVYPLLQRVVPPVRSFRYPIKFFLFSSFGLAMLAASAAHALQTAGDPALVRRPTRAMVGAGLAASLALAVVVGLFAFAPFTAAQVAYRVGVVAGLRDPVEGAAFLFRSVPGVATRTIALFAAGALLTFLGWASSRGFPHARMLLFTLAAGEVVLANAGQNPAMAASLLGPPPWVEAVARTPGDRFYFGGKFRGSLTSGDVDLPAIAWHAPKDVGVEEGRSVFMTHLAMTPAAWGVRELLSYDLPQLWPVEHAKAAASFEHADRPARLRFLARGGVRHCLVGSPPVPGASPIRPVGEPFGPMAVYECVPNARRTYVVTGADVVPSIDAQLSRLFDAAFAADARVMIEREGGAPAGVAGAPAAPAARITVDAATRVVVEASVPDGGGYLVLLDSYDPEWRVRVDGRPAVLLRGNALYRTVRLAGGSHTVDFVYAPSVLRAWLPVSALAGAALLGVLAWPARRRAAASARARARAPEPSETLTPASR